MKKTTSAVMPMAAVPGAATAPAATTPPEPSQARGLWTASLGVLFSAAFYSVVWLVQWAPLHRYFLGHPVAVAATVLFWLAIAILLGKWIGLVNQSSQLETIRDEDLIPNAPASGPAGRWLAEHNAGVVAKNWLSVLEQLPVATRATHLLSRLTELLTRQSHRGTSKHIADDLRELAARDADDAHDSYNLVRIIVWAIPMLGFLGTVVGITQTLGELDFSDGTAAVDRLKSGLYVAFDTTALGIVLSVVAIFLQFPVERGEQRLLATIDARVGRLISTHLPSDDAADNQTTLIADLCEGIRAAVAESLSQQTELWRSTIDSAHDRWQDIHQSTATQITEAFSTYLSPALRDHAGAIDESARMAGDRMERQWSQWQETMSHHADRMVSQQQMLLSQCQLLSDVNAQAESLRSIQSTLDVNLMRLQETNAAIDQSVSAAAGDGMADAMRILARAVDVLSHRMSHGSDGTNRLATPRRVAEDDLAERRAA